VGRSWIGSVLSMVALSAPFACGAFAHPGSGIVVDEKGQVFFQDTVGRAIWKIDAQGKLTKFDDKRGGHWMALDSEGSFSRADLKLVGGVERITPSGVKPALIVAPGGAPIVVNRDGNLYYGLRLLDGDKRAPGITQISPDGKQTLFAPELIKTVENQWITGLATGPDGSLYLAYPSAVFKVRMDGTFTTLVRPVVVKDCDEDLPDGATPSPYLRGLAVDLRGTVYAAATGYHCVVKITPGGKVETVLKAERPWSPTGVALFGGDLYVLEYINPIREPASSWVPRVRKLGRDGKVTILATLARDQEKSRP
jgi:sugar lactone lactonase YvrE